MRSDPLATGVHIEIVDQTESRLLEFGEFGKSDVRFEEGVITGAVIALDVDNIERLQTGTGPQSWQSLVGHELAHALGLDHTDNPTDLMHVNWSQGSGVLSSGDIAGLQTLRSEHAC